MDELHTYRGRQGADVALLIRRLRDRVGDESLQYVGTSATMASGGNFDQQQKLGRIEGRRGNEPWPPERSGLFKLWMDEGLAP